MATNKYKCGDNAYDEYNDPKSYYHNIRHSITGNGKVTKCYPNLIDNYKETYTICEGITELGDDCLSKTPISSITLPKTLLKIGNRCFKKSSITQICLPENLEEIGHDNFPSSLMESINIPANIQLFPIDNITTCDKLKSVIVHSDNKCYRAIDDVLYNYDLTEILFCPRGKAGEIFIPNGVRKIGDHCFENCKQITSVFIPSSVEEFGDYAFSQMELENLNMPRTVNTIGIGCFYETKISLMISLSKSITKIPDYCFYHASIKFNKIPKVESIGNCSFEGVAELPAKIDLSDVKSIGNRAFAECNTLEEVSLGCNLKYVGSEVFSHGNENINVVYMSYAPHIDMKTDFLKNIGKSATVLY